MKETKDWKRINQYTCRTCGESIVTLAKDYGTTPMMLNCRATVGCDGMMQSMMHMVNQSLKPDFEWYKPKNKVKDRAMREHVAMGGLMIRRYMKLPEQN